MHFSIHHPTLLLTSFTLTSLVSAIPGRDVLKCLQHNRVPFIINNSPNWTDYTTPHNLRLQYAPAVITIPETTQQVSASVKCAVAAKLKVQPKGGGHSYASYSSGGQDGSLIVDMERFDLVDVDQSTYIAKIGAGQRLGNVATEIYNQGRRALPHGVCPGVGIAGHALHGGWGFAGRYWGYTLDTIVGLDVVLANGKQVYTSRTRNPDLFYAMRGAGESFGIATHLYLQTQPAPASAVLFSVNLSSSMRNIDILTAGFKHVQDLVISSPLITPNMTFGFNTDTRGTLMLSGLCIGCNVAALNNTVLPTLLANFSSNRTTIAQNVGWLEGLTFVAGQLGTPLQQPLGHEYNIRSTFYVKSLMTKNAHPLTTDAIRSFFSYILAHPGAPLRSVINLYGGPGSAMNIPSSDSTAYSQRDAMWVFEHFGMAPPNGNFDPNTIALVEGVVDSVTHAQPDGDFAAYLNYIDPELNAETAATLYYGADTYNRLLKLKKKFDPKFVFWNPQAVGNSRALREE